MGHSVHLLQCSLKCEQKFIMSQSIHPSLTLNPSLFQSPRWVVNHDQKISAKIVHVTKLKFYTTLHCSALYPRLSTFPPLPPRNDSGSTQRETQASTAHWSSQSNTDTVMFRDWLSWWSDNRGEWQHAFRKVRVRRSGPASLIQMSAATCGEMVCHVCQALMLLLSAVLFKITHSIKIIKEIFICKISLPVLYIFIIYLDTGLYVLVAKKANQQCEIRNYNVFFILFNQ